MKTRLQRLWNKPERPLPQSDLAPHYRAIEQYLHENFPDGELPPLLSGQIGSLSALPVRLSPSIQAGRMILTPSGILVGPPLIRPPKLNRRKRLRIRLVMILRRFLVPKSRR